MDLCNRVDGNYRSRCPVFVSAAASLAFIEQEAAEIGVDHFLSNPFFMSTFKEAVKRIMGRQEQPKSRQSNVVRDKHILVVDDIEVNRIVLLKILGSLGIVCDSASNSQESVYKFNSSQPGNYNLILMDTQMPVMDAHIAKPF